MIFVLLAILFTIVASVSFALYDNRIDIKKHEREYLDSPQYWKDVDALQKQIDEVEQL